MEKQITKSDTARSWRAMRLVFCCICSIGYALAGFHMISESADNQVKSDAIQKVDASGLTGDALMNAEHNISVTAPMSSYLAKGLLFAVLGGIAGWIGAWLFILVVAFIWWFVLDRIREFMRAMRGQP